MGLSITFKNHPQMLHILHQRLICLHLGDIAAVDIRMDWALGVLNTELIITAGVPWVSRLHLQVKDGHPVRLATLRVDKNGTVVHRVVAERIVGAGPVEWREIAVHSWLGRTGQNLRVWQSTSLAR